MTLPPFEEVAVFHGHICPGLAFGYRAAEYAKKSLNTGRSEDEEMVTIVENDACMIDAIQYITGCTMGKGNLIFRDHGKPVYTFILRNGNKAVRIAQRPAFGMDTLFPEITEIQARVAAGTASDADQKQMQELRSAMIKKILTAPLMKYMNAKRLPRNCPSGPASSNRFPAKPVENQYLNSGHACRTVMSSAYPVSMRTPAAGKSAG